MDKIKKILRIILMVILSYVCLVSIIQRVKRPDLTEGQLFLLLPCNLILDFK